MITVHCTARSAALAQHILQVYVRSFKEHHTRLHRTPGSFEFFATQAAEVKQRLASAEQQLRDAKDEVGVSSIAAEKQLLENRLTALEKDLIGTRTALAAAQAKIERLLQEHPDLELDSADNASSAPAQEIASMRTELFKLEIQERELLAKLSPTHPKVLAIREQVKEAQAIFARQNLLSEQAIAMSLNVKRSELQKQSAETKQELLRLNESELRIKDLSQQVAALEANFKAYEDKSEKARVDGAMATEQLSDVNVVQAATLNPKPASPKKAIILVLGFLAAAFSAFAVTMIAEFIDDTFQLAEQVEAVLELPVILSVPDFRQPAPAS